MMMHMTATYISEQGHIHIRLEMFPSPLRKLELRQNSG